MTRRWMALVMVVALVAGAVLGDIYMQNPRGTNNRLNEEQGGVRNDKRLFDSQNNANGGYHWGPPMYFYEGSILPIEWTNQHSCGPHNPNCDCNIVIQYMCEETLRDGVTTNTVPDDARHADTVPGASLADTYFHQFAAVLQYGRHETYEYYQACKARDRNNGLFSADKNLNGRTARSTRQSPGTTRFGFECPEERDYYPYWHPTPWRDIAILTDDLDRCDMYQEESFNVKGRNQCTLAKYNNEAECVTNGGVWEYFGPHDIDPPVCVETPFNRDNHLGNTIDGYTNTFNWTIPERAEANCVLRIRYNISSTDYDGWNTYSSSNGQNSPVKPDPYVQYGNWNLSLAINTAQFGRTFEDRSNQFDIRSRPSGVSNQARIWNINVRGKRGNIVQTFPSTEYDFTPQRLEPVVGDYLHFQWTGSDNNPAGRAGEGKDKTDRSNVVMLASPGGNYPMAFGETNFWDSSDQENRMAHLEQQGCLTLDELKQKHGNGNQNGIDNDDLNCFKLNAAPRYYDGGLHRMLSRHAGNTYHYMSTRNNNFTNRSQKGTIVVLDSPHLSPFLMALIGIVVAGATVVVVTPLALLAPTLVFVVIASVSQRI